MIQAAPRFLALGDSYTIGEGLASAEAWPWQLRRVLAREGVALAPPRILATTGWTTDELAAALDRACFAPPYDLVSLAVGVNNQYRGRDGENYRVEFADPLGRAVALAGARAARVLVVSIPDWGVTPFARAQGRDRARIGREIDALNALAREASAAVGAAFVDVTAISRDPAAAQLLVGDGLHPSAAQYALWVAAIRPFALAALGMRTASPR